MYSENLIVNNLMLVAVNTKEIFDRIVNACAIYKSGATDNYSLGLMGIVWAAEREFCHDCITKGMHYTASKASDRKEMFSVLRDYIISRADELA